MKKRTLICKNCGEEISNPKAEICVKCGVRVRQNIFTKIIGVSFLVFLIIVIGVVVLSILTEETTTGTPNKAKEERRKSYVGTWELQTNETLVSYETKHEDYFEKDKINVVKHELIIDEVLEITDENAYYGMLLSSCGPNRDDSNGKWEKRCPTVPPIVRLNTNDKIVAINFISPNGDGSLLCFERTDDTITQIKCGTANSDENNPEGLYSMNGGINEKFNIVYKKVK